ncbi:MAG: molybdopterin dehydrogenase FAD-binding protein [Pseudonocardia sp.]|jgi:carbon-monoxide dehydrogenase medium subunit|uniref:FAD binding domain-containing protein n=1 Tax=Pseudonocardia sp. TaxID=60912 RepID=UPI0026223FD0|nr:FAD binding domain-containing protein [Pseudonocardia sp.]MCU1626586.1 molybdopterin dehydrogenase FAD-binding protein [Pseudonocardia sp.]MDT7703187.1 aerobic carbon-monoxide dehydrogenase medium subunit [Pseudonocardiales bacterium]
MKPFTWLAPDTTAGAVAMLREHAPDARAIAGGQSLLLALKDRSARPTHLVSLSGIDELTGVRTADDGSLVVGAATTYAVLARASLAGWHGVLAEVAGDLADRPVRNRGTIGGALCTADPRYDMPAFAIGVGAGLRVSGASGDRAVAAEDFAEGAGVTALGPDEILTAVVLPPLAAWDTVAFEKFRHRVFDAAIVSVTCALRQGPDGTVAETRLAVGGATPVPVTAPVAAALLAEGASAAEVGTRAADEVLPGGTTGGEAVRYRHELIRSLVRRAVDRALSDVRTV